MTTPLVVPCQVVCPYISTALPPLLMNIVVVTDQDRELTVYSSVLRLR